jgi:hypothetical protein
MTEEAKKGKAKSKSSTNEPAKKGYATSTPESGKTGVEKEEGPWIASQQHFSGYPGYSPGMNPAQSEADSSAAAGMDSSKTEHDSSTAGPDCSAVTGEAAFLPPCIRQGERVKALIAVVPDPVQTHMALRFDRAIDAIELAAESMKYEIDRYWLPWESETKADWTDYESWKKARSDRQHKETQPGLLLFRREDKSEAQESMLYVFLVAEKPTAGINGEQFRKAVHYADLVNASHPGPDKRGPPRRDDFCSSEKGSARCTYVVGPTSSASFATLAGLMQRQPGWKNKFVVNATARNSDAIQAVVSDLSLSSFATSIPEAAQQLKNALAENGYIRPCRGEKKHQVAILSEASTALGNSFGVASDDRRDSDPDNCIDIFRYPREIASLRNAYGALNPQSPKAGEPSGGPRPSLSVNLTETNNSSDEPPDFSKAQSPFSQEAALMDMAAEMQRKHYDYIGINGSNPLDVVFLLGFLRNAVPDARLFSFDSDLLMQHEPDNVPYIGTLSVTAYPLLYPPLNEIGERRTPEGSARLPFTSQREEAIYNATVCLVRTMLGESDLGYLSERDACPPAPNERKASAEAPTPPLWLTAYGLGGHWPIQVLGPAADDTPSPQLEKLELPSGWKAICTLLSALALLHVLILLGQLPFLSKFQAFKLSTVAPARQLLGIHLASATLALAMALVGLSAWQLNKWTVVSMGFIGVLLGVSWLITRKYICWWRADRAKPQRPYLKAPLSPSGMVWQMAAFLGIWIAAGVFAYLWCTLRNYKGGHYGAFFSFRALNVASIVSPLTPMLPLLAAIYLAWIFYVWHLVFSERIRPRLNPRDEESSPVEKLRPGRRSEKRIARAVNEDFKNAITGWLILVLWIMIFHQPQFELFERPGFKTLYVALFFLVMLLILTSAVRLFRIWHELQKFLLEINRQRVRRVLLQLKSEGSSWASIWFYGSEDPDWDYMVRSLGVVQELWHTHGKPDGSQKIDRVMRLIRGRRRELQDDEGHAHAFGISRHDGKHERAMSLAQDFFAKTLNNVLDGLSAIWALPVEVQKGIAWRKLLEKYVALRWAAFIRGVIGRIRLLIIFLAVSFSLAMISLVVYSFEPHREVLWAVTAVFMAIGLIIVKVLIEMHRDPVLSYITNTKPGQLDSTFFLHLTLGVAPLLTLLATYFPGIGRYVISFLQPGLEALKH